MIFIFSFAYSNRKELATLIGQLAEVIEGKVEGKDSNSESSGTGNVNGTPCTMYIL